MKKPSVILMGSKPGSVVALEILMKRGWDIKSVVVSRKVTHPWIGGPTLEETARENGIKIYSQRELPRAKQTDFIISYMFRYLVKSDVISLGRRAAVNFHAGPLPEFGGWAFYNIAILENSPEYGCTCHYMDDGFDTGPLFKVRRFQIDPSQETAFSLERKAQMEMTRLFIDFCEIAETCEHLPKEDQDKEQMRYLKSDEFDALKKIPPDADEETIDRYARAFWYPPYQCAYVEHGSTKVEIVPKIAKEHIASFLHSDDLVILEDVAKNYKKEQQ